MPSLQSTPHLFNRNGIWYIVTLSKKSGNGILSVCSLKVHNLVDKANSLGNTFPRIVCCGANSAHMQASDPRMKDSSTGDRPRGIGSNE